MKNKKNRRLLILIVLVIIIILAIVIIRNVLKENEENEQSQSGVTAETQYTTLYSDGSKMNTSSKLKEEKKYQNITISDIQLTTVNGLNTLIANVTNNGSTDIAETDMSFTFLDNQGNTIAIVPVTLPATKAGETKQLSAATTQDIINAYDFTING